MCTCMDRQLLLKKSWGGKGRDYAKKGSGDTKKESARDEKGRERMKMEEVEEEMGYAGKNIQRSEKRMLRMAKKSI